MPPPIRVLFLCTGNSARSILAEAVLRHQGGAAFEVRSAGISPKGVHPDTLETLSAAQIDAAGLQSRHVNEFVSRPFDYVITVCDNAAEHCPVFPGRARRLHWSLSDPAAIADADARRAAFAGTLQDLRDRIASFVREVAGAGAD